MHNKTELPIYTYCKKKDNNWTLGSFCQLMIASFKKIDWKTDTDLNVWFLVPRRTPGKSLRERNIPDAVHIKAIDTYKTYTKNKPRGLTKLTIVIWAGVGDKLNRK